MQFSKLNTKLNLIQHWKYTVQSESVAVLPAPSAPASADSVITLPVRKTHLLWTSFLSRSYLVPLQVESPAESLKSGPHIAAPVWNEALRSHVWHRCPYCTVTCFASQTVITFLPELRNTLYSKGSESSILCMKKEKHLCTNCRQRL